MVRTRNGKVVYKVGINPMVMYAIGGLRPAALGFLEESSFSHDTVYLLVIIRLSPPVQFVGHPAISIAGKLFND